MSRYAVVPIQPVAPFHLYFQVADMDAGLDPITKYPKRVVATCALGADAENVCTLYNTGTSLTADGAALRAALDELADQKHRAATVRLERDALRTGQASKIQALDTELIEAAKNRDSLIKKLHDTALERDALTTELASMRVTLESQASKIQALEGALVNTSAQRDRLAAAEKISQSWETNGAARSAHFKNIAAENASLGRIVNDQRKTMDMWTTDWKALRKAMISRPRGMPMLTHVNQLERMLKVHQQVIAGFKGKLMGTDEAAQPEAADAKVSYAKLHSPTFEAVDPSKIGWTVDWAGYDGQRRLKVGRVRGPVVSQMRDQVLEHVIRAMRASTLPSLQNAAERIKASCEAEDAKP